MNPDAWAELFRKSGARYIMPTAQHHENFALWDSSVTPYNAVAMGPKRDLHPQLPALDSIGTAADVLLSPVGTEVSGETCE